MLKPGEQAIDFALKNQDGKEIKLSDFRGKKVVLYFYPKDNTPGCTKEACGFRDVYDDILALDAVVLGVSADTIESHDKFRRKYDLPFHLLADIDHQVCEAYGAWGEKKYMGKVFDGVSRVTYLIDEAGLIVETWPKVSPEKHAQEILAALQA